MELVKKILSVLLRAALGISLLAGISWPHPVIAASARFSAGYDAENRLVQVVSGTLTTSFMYDGDGNRVKKTDSGGTTLYVGSHYEVFIAAPTATPTPTPTPTRTPTPTSTPRYKVYLPIVMSCYYAIEGRPAQAIKYYFVNGKRIAMRRGCSNQVTYFYHDHLGSTVAADNNQSSRYWPYGGTRMGSVGTAYKFTGQRLDESTGCTSTTPASTTRRWGGSCRRTRWCPTPATRRT